MANPECFKCIHFYITIDERFPRGCKVFGIKGKSIPSIDVKRATGIECPVFKSKETDTKEYIKEDRIIDTMA